MSKVVCAIRASGDERPILWLRFNPDFFSCESEKIRVGKKERESRLLECIADSGKLISKSFSVSLIYMYYDCYLDRDTDKMMPIISLDPEQYDPQWAELICGTIVD